MKLSDFDYNLPENLIAQKPTLPRDHCRLLVVDRKKSKFEHKKFLKITESLKKGDVLVFNDSKVIPARLHGKKNTGGNVEILLIKKNSTSRWEVLLKNFKNKELGKKIIIAKNFIATPIKNIDGGLWLVEFNSSGDKLKKLIYKHGQTPLPPYIKKMAKLSDYQTIYAQKEGSAAAPTAGLHFTKNLLNKLKNKGIQLESITLHVGLGTFAPIKDDNIEKHKMHSEFAEISAKTARAINKAKADGRRVIAVGTTSARTIEAFANKTTGKVGSGKKEIDIFISPGYDFKILDGMITNFHLPKTTLLLLISALACHERLVPSKIEESRETGREKIMRAYQEAIKKKYKFFSFGDAMLII